MKITSSKKTQRIENKNKEMAALRKISKLNDYDRALKKKQKLDAVPTDNNSIETNIEPKPKRLKTEL